MLRDYGTTSVPARKQIENFLIKSGDTGFGSGNAIVFEESTFMTYYIFYLIHFYGFLLPLKGQLCAPP